MGASRAAILTLSVVVEGGLLALAYGIGALIDVDPFGALEAEAWSAGALGTLATLPMLLGFWLSMRSAWSPLRRIRELLEQSFMPLLARCGALDLLLISVLAGVGEEALFRGVAQVALGGWLGEHAGLLLASLLFGLAHAVTPAYVVIATLMGLYLGWLMQYSGGMIAPVVTHALYDFVALAYLSARRASEPLSAP
jgi:membrane protease YdiL (CAAX protease family)